MADKNKQPPADDFAAGMRTIDEAAKVPNDEIEIAADDVGASALAQKVDEVRRDDNSPRS